ncbi:MAG: hypothetical protein U0003_03675 [Vampirovibrionales bacterium]
MDAPLSLITATLRGNLGEALKQTERRIAQQSAEAPWIRQALLPLGMTGQGVTIQVVERSVPDVDGTLKPLDHAKAVAALITDPTWGYAPQATVSLSVVPSWMPKRLAQCGDDLASLDAFVWGHLVDAAFMNHLQGVLASPHPPHIMNVSNGLNWDAIGQQMMLLLLERDEFDRYKRPSWLSRTVVHRY